MTLPGSGQISLGDIADERGESLNNVSLETISTTGVNQASDSKPDGNIPHSLSEFYGYDDNATSFTAYESSEGSRDPDSACNLNLTQIYYHDGVNSLPEEGDNVYSDSNGKNPLATGFYSIDEGNYILVDVGVVTLVETC